MHWKKIGITAALATTLGLGMAFGLGEQAGVVSAQSVAQVATTSAESSLGSLFLDKLAAALGIQRTALDSAMASAATSATGELVQQGTLTQAQADMLTARAQAGDYGALFGGRGGPQHGPRVAGLHEAMTEAAAQALGLTADELRTALHDGETVADLAAVAGTSEEAVTDAALAAGKAKLDEAVAAGTLTQAQADTIYAQLEERGLRLDGPGGPGGRGGPRGDREPPADGTAPDPAATTPDA